jgi:predicted RNA-binding protein Jag
MTSDMDSLASIFFAPGAIGSVANAAKGAASAVARPFAEVLSALTAPEESATEGSEEQVDAATVLEDRAAERLQEILESVGAESGDEATVSYDPETDEVQVLTPASWGDEAGIDISTDGDLMDALRELAASNDTNKPLELLVNVG